MDTLACLAGSMSHHGALGHAPARRGPSERGLPDVEIRAMG